VYFTVRGVSVLRVERGGGVIEYDRILCHALFTQDYIDEGGGKRERGRRFGWTRRRRGGPEVFSLADSTSEKSFK